MSKYRVSFSQVTWISVDVEADDPDTALERAYDEAPASICAQCSGWNQLWDRDDDAELEFEDVSTDSGEIVMSSGRRWRRVRDEATTS
jgi:hypothetical protein